MQKFLVFLGCALPMCAQTGNVVGAGYQAPAPVSAAPGQILTLLVDTPSLTGITVTLHQGTDQAVPVRDVRSVSTGPGIVTIQVVGQPQCPNLAAVTVQIPYELMTVCPPCARPAELAASLIVSVNGATGTVISLNPVSDQVHVLTVCDIAMQPAGSTPQANTSVL